MALIVPSPTRLQGMPRSTYRSGARPCTKLYNFKSGALPYGLSFTRASSATYVNASGVLTTAATNAPRFDYNPVTLALNGLLLEEQRTNIVLQSSTLQTGGSWAVSAGALSNDGGQTNVFGSAGTSKFVPDTTNSIHRCQFQWNPNAGQTYSVTVFLKSAGVRYVYINTAATLNASICIDLLTGNYAAGLGAYNVSVLLLSNGFYRVQYTNVGQSVSGNNIWLQANSVLAAIDTTYASDGVSGFYIGGVQIEAGSFPTSYIPTTTAAATRASDSLTASGVSSWFGPNQGTYAVEFMLMTLPQANVALVGASSRPTLAIGSNYVKGSYPGVVDVVSKSVTMTVNAVHKGAFSFQAGNYAVTMDRQTSATSTNAQAVTVASSLVFGADVACLNGWLRTFRYWNTALTNTQLQQVTT